MMRKINVVFIAAMLVIPALAVMAEEPAPPREMGSGSDSSSQGILVETAPVGPQNPAAFIPVEQVPEATSEGFVGVIHMKDVPESLSRDTTLPDRYHIQGMYRGEKSGEISRTALVPAEHDTPEAKIDVSRQHEGAKAFGNEVTRWNAQASSGWIPPDTQMAVGPEYIVEAVNSGFTVFTKTGTQTRAYTDFEGFITLPTGWAGFAYDPRVLYSNEYGKFVMLILGLDETNKKSYFWIMTSQTSDPNGAWWIFRREVSRGGVGSEEWLDFASLGVDHWGVYVTGNYFGFTSGFSSSALWSENTNILSGGGGGGYYWSDLEWPSGSNAFSVHPAHPHSQNASGNTFLVNSNSGAGTEVCLWTLHGERWSGQGGDPVSLNRVAIAARTYYAIGSNIDQDDNATDLDGGDCRVGNAVYSNGIVYTVFTIDPDNDQSNSEIYAIALNSGAGTKNWDYTMWSNSYYMFYPSMTIEGSTSPPNWMAAFSMTSPGSGATGGYPGTIAFIRDDAANTNSFYWDHYGEGDYVRLDGSGLNRWGDYSMTGWDWTSGAAWSAQEFSTSTNNWNTSIFSRMLNDDPIKGYVHLIDPNGGQSLIAGNTYTVNWEHMNNPSGDNWYIYFDDGTTNSQASSNLGDTATSSVWTVPNIGTTTGKVNVRAYGTAWGAIDYSDDFITVKGCTEDVYEFNDTVGAATAIANGNNLSNTICVTSDLDYFTFTLAATSAVTLETSGPTGDTRMWLYQSDGTSQIEYDDDGGTGAFSIIERTCGANELAAGTYYVKIDEYLNNQHIDDYTMSLTTSTCAEGTIFIDGFESGGSGNWSATVN